MNQEKNIIDEIEEVEIFKSQQYENLALKIIEKYIRSRDGFGAFQEYESLFRNTSRLIFKSGFISNFNDEKHSVLPIRFHPKYWDMDLYQNQSFRYVFESFLAKPFSYNPSCVWALFWALAKAEHEFLSKYIPYWSNEERLTGHLVSQMLTRLEDFEHHWANLDSESEVKDRSYFQIRYFDTATARNEKITGADLGLIVQVKIPNRNEYFKVARFQAKKVDSSGSARIDLSQVSALLERENLGYFLFYHKSSEDKWNLAPTVCSAKNFSSKVENAREEAEKEFGGPFNGSDENLGEESIPVRNTGNDFDFASFLTFALADQASNHGVFTVDAKNGARILMNSDYERILSPLSRIVVVTLGVDATEIDWNHLFGEMIGKNNE